MCSGSEAGSYLRLIDLVYHSTLGLGVIKKRGKGRSSGRDKCRAIQTYTLGPVPWHTSISDCLNFEVTAIISRRLRTRPRPRQPSIRPSCTIYPHPILHVQKILERSDGLGQQSPSLGIFICKAAAAEADWSGAAFEPLLSSTSDNRTCPTCAQSDLA